MLRKRLKIKFIVYLVALVACVSFIFLFFFINRASSLVQKELNSVGKSLARSLSYSSELGIASEDQIFLKPYLERVFQEEDVLLVAVYNKKGRIITANSKANIDENISYLAAENLIHPRDVVMVKDKVVGKDEHFYDFYSPIFIGEILSPSNIVNGDRELAGFARVALSLKKVDQENQAIIFFGFLLTLALIALGALLSVLISRRLTNPINVLRKGAQTIGQGNLEHRIKITTGDELEGLAESFNQMAKNLQDSHFALEESKNVLEIKVKARTKELRELADSLEKKVQERTKALQAQISELEKFHHLTVGRELKMIELKKEIKENKTKLGQTKKRSKQKVAEL